MKAKYTKEDLKKWWPAVCPGCGWKGLSRDCYGGGQIADTGDYDDLSCPECVESAIKACERCAETIDCENADHCPAAGSCYVDDDEDYIVVT